MSVVDLAQERLMRAMVDTAVAASTGDSQKLDEKAEVLKKVLDNTDLATVQKVTGSGTPNVTEVVSVITSLLRAAGDLGRLIERLRG